VDAVQCAVEVQNELKDKNNKLPEDRKLKFRIGINISDVIQDRDVIFGEVSMLLIGLRDLRILVEYMFYVVPMTRSRISWS
jgi:hypothetical protein